MKRTQGVEKAEKVVVEEELVKEPTQKEIAEQAPQSEKELETVTKKIRWKKIGGGSFRMTNGSIIKPQQTFLAFAHEIPQGFRDVVVPIDEEEVRKVEELVSVTEWSIADIGDDQYNLIGESGKAINHEPLSLTEAKEMREALS